MSRQTYRISDEIVDLFFRESIADGMSPWDVRVAAETLTTTNKVVIAGETRGTDKITKDMIEERARAAIKDIGYEQEGFHWKHADVDVLLHAQSVDIAQGVDSGTGLHAEEGAGDQGIMFGYASSDVPGFLMPAPVHYSHKILERLARARKHEGISQLGPDSKSQVTVRYHNGRPVEATAIVLSTQHLDAAMDSKDVADLVKPYIEEVLPTGWITDKTNSRPLGGLCHALSGEEPCRGRCCPLGGNSSLLCHRCCFADVHLCECG